MTRYVVTIYALDMASAYSCATLSEAYARVVLYGRGGRWKIQDLEVGATVAQSPDWGKP